MNLDLARNKLTAIFRHQQTPMLLGRNEKLVIYGAGNCGRDVLRVLQGRGYQIVAFLDAQAREICTVDGIPCFAIETEEARELAAAGCSVAIAVFNRTSDLGAVEIRLKQIGFHKIIPYYALNEKFSEALVSRYWLAPRSFLNKNRSRISEALDLWADDLSRSIFLDLIMMRVTWNMQLLRKPDRQNQYYPESLPPPKNPMRLIDGGAFDGDTIHAMQHFGIESVAAFEPDLENFRQLSYRVESEKLCAGSGEVTLFPCGLGAVTGMRRFQAGQGEGSSISETGDKIIQVVALDDVLPRFAPTFIKLDIEGAEIEALKGAIMMIQKYQPRIAACVYHLPDHLWEIPLLLHKLLPSHSLSLRYHGFNGFDAVAYAMEP